MGKPRTDLTGLVFERLTVVKYVGDVVGKSGKANWECQCSCGGMYYAGTSELRKGYVVSCGCKRRESKFCPLPPGEHGLVCLFASYRDTSRKRGLVFELNSEEFRALVLGNCYYCGREPSRSIGRSRKGFSTHGEILTNGIDRMSNNIGYVLSNCISCCWKCNKLKGSRDTSVFLEWVKMVTSNNIRVYSSA